MLFLIHNNPPLYASQIKKDLMSALFDTVLDECAVGLFERVFKRRSQFGYTAKKAEDGNLIKHPR